MCEAAMKNILLKEPISKILKEKPFVLDFFESFGIDVKGENVDIDTFFDQISENFLEDVGTTKEDLKNSFLEYVTSVEGLANNDFIVNSVTIIGGIDKSKNPENFTLTVHKGEVICIVGPTGSGKSRLLADIEWMAQGDTPTKRTILINGEKPEKKWRFSTEHKLVAQLSQNMNFVMDLTVEEFIRLHAESRFVKNIDEKVKEIIDEANSLAGEEFKKDTPITALSGGQSRALMIADTAFLSKSPIVLIDEIENAGIDRKKALELLVREEKIVLMATHDPILALMGDKRLVIRNGGVFKIIESCKNEKAILPELEKIDRMLLNLRTRLRNGEILENI
jgi:ABC-type lipoprotein export system ATPase subunit